MTDDQTEYVLVTEYFHPDTASTGQLMTDLAVGLKDRGLDMTVYTGQPNYRGGPNERQPRKSTHQGVSVNRIRAPQLRQSSLPRRLFNWGVFTIWMFLVLLVSRSDGDREVLFVSNPPMLPIAMWIVCRIRGWDYTYIVYDLYPDQPVELGYLSEDGLIHRSWAALNGRALLAATNVVALGPRMEARIAAQAGPMFDKDTVTIIHNWADADFIEPKEKSENTFSEEHDLVDSFTVLYSGNIGEFHDLETVVDGAARFNDDDVTVLIIGEGDNKASIVDRAEANGTRGETVEFLPYQPRDVLPESLTSGDVSVVTVREGFEGICVSSKLYTAMAAGMPVLGIVQPEDDEARIIDAFDAGIHVEQGDVDGFVEAIDTWRSNPEHRRQQGANARAAFESYFTKTQSIDRYYRLLTDGAVAPDVTRTTAVTSTESA
ncbi:glycosyltransferase family 4 protein [Halorhabdus sp. CUG00001]|uniref:glycosyltransferase family 4 protein n=1 Tax=Halorhabdus sp. CUG00001 TaxID=2600297 RepID=UPI00131C8BD4|nr:glycosyltransferase family 4 protein [Halorhabdus sp. CUG00001]